MPQLHELLSTLETMTITSENNQLQVQCREVSAAFPLQFCLACQRKGVQVNNLDHLLDNLKKHNPGTSLVFFTAVRTFVVKDFFHLPGLYCSCCNYKKYRDLLGFLWFLQGGSDHRVQ